MALQNNANTKANVLNTSIIGIKFITDGVGDPALVDDYGGDVTIEKDTNRYILNLATMNAIGTFVCTPCTFSTQKDINNVITTDSGEKTIECAFDAPVRNTRVDILVVYVSPPPP